MSNMMIYATTDKVGGNIEFVWGYKMRVRTIDSSDKDEVEQAKADDWVSKAGDVIEQIETQKLEAENKVMKGKLSSGDGNKRIKELEDEVKDLKSKLAVYEQSADKDGDGNVSNDELTIPQLVSLLKQRGVEHNARDGKDALVKLANESE